MLRIYFSISLLSLLSFSVFAVNPPGVAINLYSVPKDAHGKLRVHFIDIGGGMAAMIETPSGRHILIDAGQKEKNKYRQYVDYFLNGKSVDLLIITHADSDHFANQLDEDGRLPNGKKKYVLHYIPHEFIYTGYESTKLSKLVMWPQFISEIEKYETQGLLNWSPVSDYVSVGTTELLDSGSKLIDKSDDLTITYLNVDKQPAEKEYDAVKNKLVNSSESHQRNNASLVFKLIYGETSFLFTGDINGRYRCVNKYDIVIDVTECKNGALDNDINSEEKELLDRHNSGDSKFNLKSTVYQVPHHGSDGSVSQPFIEAVAPDWAVIPAGNSHGHPHHTAINRLQSVVTSGILRTDEGPSTDALMDDSYIFTVNQNEIESIERVKIY